MSELEAFGCFKILHNLNRGSILKSFCPDYARALIIIATSGLCAERIHHFVSDFLYFQRDRYTVRRGSDLARLHAFQWLNIEFFEVSN